MRPWPRLLRAAATELRTAAGRAPPIEVLRTQRTQPCDRCAYARRPWARKSGQFLRTLSHPHDLGIPHQGAKFASLRPCACQWRRWVREVRNRARLDHSQLRSVGLVVPRQVSGSHRLRATPGADPWELRHDVLASSLSGLPARPHDRHSGAAPRDHDRYVSVLTPKRERDHQYGQQPQHPEPHKHEFYPPPKPTRRSCST